MVSREEGENYAKESSISFFAETSALDGTGIVEAVEQFILGDLQSSMFLLTLERIASSRCEAYGLF